MDTDEDIRGDAILRLTEGYVELRQKTDNLELTVLILSIFNVMCWAWFQI